MTLVRLWLNLGLIGLIVMTVIQLGAIPEIGKRISSEAGALAGHAILYFFVGLVLARFAVRAIGAGRMAALGITAALILAMGTFDEVRQMAIYGRTAAFNDVVADLAGGVLGGMVYLFWSRMGHTVAEADAGVSQKKKLVYAMAGAFTVASAFAFASLQPTDRAGTFESLVIRGIAFSDRMYVHRRSSLDRQVPVRKDQESSVIAASKSASTNATKREAQSDHGRRDAVKETDLIGHPAAPSVESWEFRERLADNVASVGPKAVSQIYVRVTRTEPATVEVQPHQIKEMTLMRQELAQLEIRDLSKFAYSPDYPQRAWLRRKVNSLLDGLSELQKDLQSPERVSLEVYLNTLKRELARLEIQDVRLLAYSDVHPKRLLLKEKADYLRGKIERVEKNGNCAKLAQASNDQYMKSLRIGLERLHELDRRMDHFVESYPPRTLLQQQIDTLEHEITLTTASGPVCSIPRVLVRGIFGPE